MRLINARTGENLWNGFCVFRHALNYKVTGKRIPLMVSLCTTNRCNLRCGFCYAGTSDMKAPEYATEELFDFIDEFCRLGTRIFLIQGGEPTLRGDIAAIIGRVKKKRRYCRISTNGVLVEKKIGELKDLDMISFSLDGSREITDKIRGEGVYDAVIKGLTAAKEYKIPSEIHAVLIRESACRASIVHLLDIASQYDIYVSFCVAAVSGAENTQKVGSADLSKDEVKDLYHFLIGLKEKGYRISNSINSLRKTLSWPLQYSEIGYPENLPKGYKYTRCRYGQLIAYLDGYYVLRPCAASYGRPDMGWSIKNRSIAQAWGELSKLKCMACGGSDESTNLFALNLRDIAGSFKHLIRR